MVLQPDIIARMAIAEYLRGCGYKVVEGVTSEDVMTVLRAGIRIDVVFAEVRLAGDLDGLDLAKKIRANYPHVDVLLTVGTANATEKAAELCEEGPLVKPYHPQELLRRIEIMRERRRTLTDG